jgi:hypothetical protein
LRVGASLPVPAAHTRIKDPEAFLARPALADRFDLLLLPAYVAAGLIQEGALRTIGGVPGRAHDPDGAYTLPYAEALTVEVTRAGGTPAAGPAAWPALRRVVLGAALRERGYSPNDPHPGHLVQAGADLLAARPHLAEDPLAELAAGRAGSAHVLLPVGIEGWPAMGEGVPGGGTAGLAWRLPAWGGLRVAFDWVVPAGTADAAEALDLARSLPPALPEPGWARGLPAVPLAPLAGAARAEQVRVWEALGG